MTTPVIPSQRRRFSARAFNQPIFIRPSNYAPLTSQGGANPGGLGGFAYLANVQAIAGRANWTQRAGGEGGGAGMPQSTNVYEVRLPFDADDPVILALRIGDTIEWTATGGGILTVQGTPNNPGGWNAIWLIRCEQVNS